MEETISELSAPLRIGDLSGSVGGEDRQAGMVGGGASSVPSAVCGAEPISH